jgi:hypothetical protein
MAETRIGAESRYQLIFADFFVGAAEAEAHLYSIKALCDNILNLASLLGMSQENLQALLVARSGLGSIQKDRRSNKLSHQRNHQKS